MKIAGIICEFNPFHNGHKSIIDNIREENDCVICVMSGNFVQRGEPAIFAKHQRVRAALLSGADLIIELPSPWSASFAENFAFGAVSLLKEAGINSLYFGSETNDIDKLFHIAKLDENLRITKTNGSTYAKLRENAIREALGESYASILIGSNDNLGIEYIKAAIRLSANFEIKSVKRKAAGHDSKDSFEGICSASFLRENFDNQKLMSEHTPATAYELYSKEIKNGHFLEQKKYSDAVISYLRRISDFSHLPDISEGLDMKLKKELRHSSSLEELQMSVKSKRYTLARIRRLILSAFLDIDASFCEKPVPYMNILGMSKIGETALKNIAKTSALPLIFSGKPSTPLDKDADLLFNNECRRNDVYTSLLKNPYPCGLDHTEGVIKFQEENL